VIMGLLLPAGTLLMERTIAGAFARKAHSTFIAAQTNELQCMAIESNNKTGLM